MEEYYYYTDILNANFNVSSYSQIIYNVCE